MPGALKSFILLFFLLCGHFLCWNLRCLILSTNRRSLFPTPYGHFRQVFDLSFEVAVLIHNFSRTVVSPPKMGLLFFSCSICAPCFFHKSEEGSCLRPPLIPFSSFSTGPSFDQFVAKVCFPSTPLYHSQFQSLDPWAFTFFYLRIAPPPPVLQRILA